MTIKQDNHQPRWDQVARRWWATIQGKQEHVPPRGGIDRAALARLRRASTPVDALEEPAVFDLYKKLGFGRNEIDRRLSRVAVVTAVLAHIKEDATPTESGFRQRFAEMLGHGEHPLMSELRFKRLLAATADHELLTAFRRAVALAGGKNIDVGDVAASLLDWSDRRRMHWAFDYYGGGIAAPKQKETASIENED
jgi:CRISPR system Cascade subunit CasB